MKKLILLLLLSTGLYAQSPFSAHFWFSSNYNMGVSPSGQLWVVTARNDTSYSKSIDSLWHHGPINSENESMANMFEKIIFFDDNRAIISGTIQDRNYQNQCIYRTEDAGKTWNKITIGKDNSIPAAWVTPNGNAWLCGSSNPIYFSDDYGKSWKELSIGLPEKDLSFSATHFTNDATVGLFGSYSNKIYRTTDNCKTWQVLPTPFSQQKYVWRSKEGGDNINKIRITANKNFYIVNQQEKVFFTKSDNINWQRMPGVTDFEVAQNGTTYIIYKDQTTGLLDQNMVPVWKSVEKTDAVTRTIEVQNNALFALTDTKIYRISPDNFKSAELLTNDFPIGEPDIKVNSGDSIIGFSDNDVLLFDTGRKQWYSYIKVPFIIGSADRYNNKIVITDEYSGKHSSVDLKNRQILPFSLPLEIIKPGTEVTSILFEGGWSSSYVSDLTYLPQGDVYKSTIDPSHEDYELFTYEFKNLPQTISKSAINELLTLINRAQHEQINSKDFNFTEKDIGNFIKFVDTSEKNIEKDKVNHQDLIHFWDDDIDFEFYRKTARQINTIESTVIDSAFAKPKDVYCSPMHYITITFQLSDGKNLVIEKDMCFQKYFYTPLTISYGALLINGNSVLIGQKIDQITKGKLLEKESKEKIYAIFEIANYLYHEQLND